MTRIKDRQKDDDDDEETGLVAPRVQQSLLFLFQKSLTHSDGKAQRLRLQFSASHPVTSPSLGEHSAGLQLASIDVVRTAGRTVHLAPSDNNYWGRNCGASLADVAGDTSLADGAICSCSGEHFETSAAILELAEFTGRNRPHVEFKTFLCNIRKIKRLSTFYTYKSCVQLALMVNRCCSDEDQLFASLSRQNLDSLPSALLSTRRCDSRDSHSRTQ